MKRLLDGIALAYVVAVAAFALALFHVVRPSGDLHFVWLGLSFLRGRLDLPAELVARSGLMDLTVRGGRYYWPLGPVPALVLAPLAAVFGAGSRLQELVHVAASFAVAALAFSVARRAGFAKRDAAWLAAAFCAGSVAVGVLALGGPWYLAQAFTLAFLLAALRERYGKARPLVEGAWIALAVATRLSAAAAALFFLATIAAGEGTVRAKARRAALFCAPVLLALALLGWYDAARFGSPFDTGYATQYLDPGDVWSGLRAERGTFSLASVADNARWYFLALPSFGAGGLQVDRRGLSFFLLSPFFLLGFFSKRRDAAWKASLAVFALVLAVWLAYYSPGYSQLGPRYLNDAMPFLFVMLLAALAGRKRLLVRHKAVIAASVCMNAVLLAAFASQMQTVASR